MFKRLFKRFKKEEETIFANSNVFLDKYVAIIKNGGITFVKVKEKKRLW